VDEVISAEGLTRRFGDLVAVDHVDFAVREGEIFGLLGPNGAGKTTTVRMLTGIIEPSQGTATVCGHDITDSPTAARQHMGIVPEEANVYLDFSTWRNLMLMGELHGVPRGERKRRGEELLDRFDLADRARQKARTLSKGLRQRLMLCMALIGQPDVLFLDEPTSGLDVASARTIRQIVSEFNRNGLTVFLTTHNMAEAEQMCGRVAIMNKGVIGIIDTPDGLRAAMKARQLVVVGFEGPGASVAKLQAVPGVSEVKQVGELFELYTETPGPVAQGVAKFCAEQGLVLRYIATQQASLEDVYLHFTTERE